MGRRLLGEVGAWKAICASYFNYICFLSSAWWWVYHRTQRCNILNWLTFKTSCALLTVFPRKGMNYLIITNGKISLISYVCGHKPRRKYEHRNTKKIRISNIWYTTNQVCRNRRYFVVRSKSLKLVTKCIVIREKSYLTEIEKFRYEYKPFWITFIFNRVSLVFRGKC